MSTSSADTSTLPGLSPSCSAVIGTQVAINALFTEALGNVASSTGATATTVDAPAGTPSGITEARVREVFEPVAKSVPASLAAAFDTLRTAATDSIGKSVDAVPAILGGKPVTDAMRAISDYIAACKPPATD